VSVPYSESGWTQSHCPQASVRAALDDEEFWAQVNRNLGLAPDPVDLADDADQDQLDEMGMLAQPCPVCGSRAACAYDNEGLPMVHTTDEADL